MPTLTVHQYAERRGIPEDEALKELDALVVATTVTRGTAVAGEPTYVVPNSELRTYNE